MSVFLCVRLFVYVLMLFSGIVPFTVVVIDAVGAESFFLKHVIVDSVT